MYRGEAAGLPSVAFADDVSTVRFKRWCCRFVVFCRAPRTVAGVLSQDPLFPLPPLEPDPVVMARPVGSVMEVASGPEGLATATYDVSEQFRFRVSRVWNPRLPRCVFVMLNPSTATAFQLDPTVRRTVSFAKAWGCGALEVVNIFAFRSTDPSALYHHPDPVGIGNDDAIVAAASAGSVVVAAWGTHGALSGRGEHVRTLLGDAGVDLVALRVTKGGFPGHPLYVPADTVPNPF
jgi:hypothetical protein